VDLSVWLLEAEAVSKHVQRAQQQQAIKSGGGDGAAANGGGGGGFLGAPRRNYLVYLLSRICSFLRNNFRLVFVSDGCAPTLKTRLTSKDNQPAANGAAAGMQSHRARQNPLFAAQIRECGKLLQLLDLPLLSLQRGEAEALCGLLNARGSCDGVLTTDGDAFLFGARCVLKDLEASSTNLAASLVRMQQVTDHTGLDRHRLILLALMLGSDYSSGVRGLGPKKAVKLLRVLDECWPRFSQTTAQGRAAGTEHRTLAIFRAMVNSPTAEEAVKMLLACHPSSSAGASVASAALSVVSSSASAVSRHPASMTLEELSMEMRLRGLKPLTSKIAMVNKLEMITSAAAATTRATVTGATPGCTPDSDEDEDPLPAVAPAAIWLSDDSDSDSDCSDAGEVAAMFAASSQPSKRGGAAAAAKRKAKGKQKDKRAQTQLSLASFLRTYVGKVHARYHSAAQQAEMELVLQSYLRPNLQPAVDVLERQIHTRMSQTLARSHTNATNIVIASAILLQDALNRLTDAHETFFRAVCVCFQSHAELSEAARFPERVLFTPFRQIRAHLSSGAASFGPVEPSSRARSGARETRGAVGLRARRT
jgi:5'-3' exonuclease